MPLYFFHILNPDGTAVPDEEGARFEDIETAKHEAVASLRDLIAEVVKQGGRIRGLGIEIVNETGQVLHTIHARETFD